jgi:hypothetical protein
VKKGYIDRLGDYFAKKISNVTSIFTSKEEKLRAIEEEQKEKQCMIECKPHKGE